MNRHSAKGWYSSTSIDFEDTLAFCARTGVRVWRSQFGKVFPGPGAGSTAVASIAPPVVELAKAPISSSPAHEALDLALSQLIATTTSVSKPAAVQSASSPLTSGRSSASDRLLLLLAQQPSKAGSVQTEHKVSPIHAKFKPADDYFASLGDQPGKCPAAAALVT